MRTKRIYSDLKAFLDDLERDGTTQAEFAERVGISAAHLSELKLGRARPSLPLAARLSTECGIPIESFLS